MSASVAPGGAKLRRVAAYVVILGAAFYLYHLAQQFSFEEVPGRIGPDAWPKLVLTILILTCLWQIVRIAFLNAPVPVREAEPDELTALDGEPGSGDYAYLAWIGIALTVAYAYVLPSLGFLVSTTLYIALMTYLGRYRRWPLVAISLIAPVVLIFVFMKIVYLSLPLGQGIFKTLSLALLKLLGVH